MGVHFREVSKTTEDANSGITWALLISSTYLSFRRRCTVAKSSPKLSEFENQNGGTKGLIPFGDSSLVVSNVISPDQISFHK